MQTCHFTSLVSEQLAFILQQILLALLRKDIIFTTNTRFENASVVSAISTELQSTGENGAQNLLGLAEFKKSGTIFK